MTRRHRKRRTARGFTLFELLVSLALLALIAVFVSGSLRFGRRAWETAHEIDYVSHVAAVRRFIEQKLTDAQPINQVTANGRVQIAFDGQAEQLTFISVSQGYTEVGGLYQYRLSVAPGSGGARGLYVTQALYRPAGPVTATEQKRLLIDRIEGLNIRYFDFASASWSPVWTNSSKLPHLAAIKVKFADGDPRRWPEQVVRIMSAQTLSFP